MIEKDVKDEAIRIIKRGQQSGLRLRLLGGLAIYLTCPSSRSHVQLRRNYADIDLIGLGKDSPHLGAFFAELGYIPDQRFNALHGLTRLLFYNPENGDHVDVFLDRFQMCHTLDLRKRLLDGYLTLTLADLLITKLQIVEINEKDMKDCLAILLDHDLGLESTENIDVNYLVSLTRRDWGLFTTMSDNLGKVKERMIEYLKPDESSVVNERVEKLLQAMQVSPKTPGWRVRSKIGRRLQWYDLPDEVLR